MAKRGQALRKARAVRRPAKPAVDLKQKNAALKRELAQALERQAATEREAVEQQTATAEVLQVINSSPGSLAPVFDAMLDKALRLCDAAFGFLRTYDGANFHLSAHRGVPPAFAEFLARYGAATSISLGTLVRGAPVFHIADAAATDDYQSGDPLRRAVVDLGGARTLLAVPLRKDSALLGAFVIYRQEVRPFSDKQIALVQNFAAQAVIAMENARLITETREALDRQTATAEVLQVINSSPGDLAPVFDAILEKAHSLCAVAHGTLQLYDGEKFRAVAVHGLFRALPDWMRQSYTPGPNHPNWRLLEGARFAHISDWAEIDDPRARALVEFGGIRTTLLIPLRKDNTLLGLIGASRLGVGPPFTEKEIALLENFAAQAVIAMENARLITETREALEQQTATAEVLQVINSSPGDLAPVFDAILEKAHRLCGVTQGILGTYDGENLRAVAIHGISEPLSGMLRQPFRPQPNSPHARLVSEHRVIHIPDLAAEPGDYPLRTAALETGVRTLLFVPLRKDDKLLGYFSANRTEVRPFSEKEIALLQNFSAQAVIAMENARLLEEIRHRNDELAEALEFQTATGEVLRIVASSPDHLQPVFDAMLEKATELCEAKFGCLFLYDGDAFRMAAGRNLPPAVDDALRAGPHRPGPNTALGRVARTKAPVHMDDVRKDIAYIERDPWRVAAVESGGARTQLAVPLLKKGELIGAFIIYRQEPLGFSETQIALVTTFADQAVIAIENARLFGELRQRTADLARSVDELTATGDVLKIISRSSIDLETVLDTLVETVARLCRADFANMFRRRDDIYHMVAARGLSEEQKAFFETHPLAADRGTLSGRVAIEHRAVHIPDVMEDPEYTFREGQKVGGYRTMLGIPLLRGDELIGHFNILRTHVEPFTNKEIELATTFADQAVIAIENARLFEELRERQAELARSVDELTATGDVLKIISRSSTDLETVLNTLVETVARLCRADRAAMGRVRDDAYHHVAGYGFSEQETEFVSTRPITSDRRSVSGRVTLERRAVHIPDVLQDPEYVVPAQQVLGYRTVLGIPLLREDALIGIFLLIRTRVEPFTNKEIELVQTFADQAVIAIENARLFEELRERQAQLARSVDELTATGDVLKIISRSSVDLETVLDTLVETVARLCRGDLAAMFRRRDDSYHFVAGYGLSEEARAFQRTNPFSSGSGSLSGRVASEHRAVHIPDVLQDPEYIHQEAQKLIGYRTMLGIPLLREETLLGILHITRTRVDPFTTKEIELATTFADQAVIAIENARLFEELRERQAELRVTFDNMGDGVVMFDSEARLTAWNRNFQDMLQLPEAFLAGRPSFAEYFRYLAERGEYASADLEEQLSRSLDDTRREMRFERTRPDGHVIEVRRNPVPDGGFVMIYSDITERKRAEEAIRAARDAAEAALRELQTAQASLVHAQKMAALGQLTAGIAHEIKNPLNFVNNFAGLSVDLLDELKQATAKAIGALDADERSEIVETIGMLTGNLEKIAEHGRRADGIVKSMLQHSRGGSGDWQASDLNVLVEEALNLAYHGARAQDQSFNITMERDLDQNLPPIEVVPQDMMRVFLNLIGNGFYAANKRSQAGDGTFRPVLKVTTCEIGDAVEIRVRDNGIGIPAEHREKLFQPFFTTKPTGEGTGLGLSISFDIVTQQHGGTITIESEVGDFTEFTVRLPRRRHSAAGRVA